MHTPDNAPSLTVRSASRDTQFSRSSESRFVPITGVRTSRVESLPRPRRAIASAAMALPIEADDAKMTGSTRSLSRRLLALNVRYDA